MSTDLDVANKALRHLGLSPIENLSANTSSMSRVLLDTLRSSIASVLGSYDWSVNRYLNESVGIESRLSEYPEYRYVHDLTQISGLYITPEGDFYIQYDTENGLYKQPITFENLVSVRTSDGLYDTKYHRMGSALYTSSKTVLISFTQPLESVETMPEYLASLVAAHVAMEGCMALTGDGNKYYVMSKIYDKELRRARSQEFRMSPKGYTYNPDSASSFIQAHSGFTL
jgi:hypothetical protein